MAAARGLTTDAVLRLIDAEVDDRPLKILSDLGVSVFELNLALDWAG